MRERAGRFILNCVRTTRWARVPRHACLGSQTPRPRWGFGLHSLETPSGLGLGALFAWQSQRGGLLGLVGYVLLVVATIHPWTRLAPRFARHSCKTHEREQRPAASTLRLKRRAVAFDEHTAFGQYI